MNRPSLELALEVNRRVRGEDERFGEPEDLDWVKTALGLRIFIELDAELGAPPTGVIRWEGFGDGTRFSGWIDMLRLLEEAVRQGGERAAKGERTGPVPEATHDVVTRRPPPGAAQD